MYYIESIRDGKPINDAQLNQAMASYFVNELKLDEPIFYFFINEPAVIIGKYQNALAEVNQPYMEEHGVKLVRRTSGGGAVYHDLGNLVYGYMADDDGNSFQNYARFTQPILDALHQIGVKEARLSGRNDLLIGERKFSGTSMYASKGRFMMGGTLMFDVNSDAVENVLRPNKAKLKSKGIKSVRSRVTNIKPFLPVEFQDITIEEFRDMLLLHIFKVAHLNDIKKYTLAESDWKNIDRLYKEQFGNWEWNYGSSPRFEYNRTKHFPVGTIEFSLKVESGRISQCSIYGDFFSIGDVTEVEKVLIGVPLEKEQLLQALEAIDMQKYFGAIALIELVELILS